jgi:hypothetical protein
MSCHNGFIGDVASITFDVLDPERKSGGRHNRVSDEDDG